jgi:hypothetical protein
MVFGFERDKVTEKRRILRMRSLMMFTHHQILFGLSNEEV